MYFSPPPPGGLGCCPFLGGGSVVVDLLFIVTPIVGVCNCYMFCCPLLYVHSSFAFILVGKRELVALVNLSSWSLVIVVWLFLVVSWVFLQFVIVVLLDYTHLVFLKRHGDVAQSVTCLITDACLTADPGVPSSIPVRSHTFVEIISTAISFLPLIHLTRAQVTSISIFPG